MNTRVQNRLNAIDILITKLKNLAETYMGNLAVASWHFGDVYCPLGTIFNTGSSANATRALAGKSCCSTDEVSDLINIFTNHYDSHCMSTGVVDISSDEALDAILAGIKALERKREDIKNLER